MSDNDRGSTVEAWIDGFDDEQKLAMRWLGQFISFYAQVEGFCHVLFRRYCGVKANVARAITGGARLADLLPMLAVVIESSDMGEAGKKDFVVCIEQLNHLTAFRHRLVHRGIEQSLGLINKVMGQFHSSNVLTAKAKESIEILRFQRHDLEAAATDCLRIYTRMQFMTLESEKQSARSLLQKDFEQALYGPWLYKPLQPEKPHQPRRKTRR